MFFFDPTILLLIPAVILAIYAQTAVHKTYRKYREVASFRGLTGAQVAHQILRWHGLHDVDVQETQGFLADHYNPANHTVNLSSEVFHGRSLASIAVAAHEVGHALQHANSYVPLQLRSTFAPIANIGSFAAFPLILGGILMQHMGLINIAIYLYIAVVLFHVITLPVEFNASSRALKILGKDGYLYDHEVEGARKVLNAAALTYVASAAIAIMELLRLLFIRSMINDD